VTTVAVLLAASQAHAVDRVWANAVNGSWNTAGNWNPAGVPTAADNLTIPFAVTVSINNGGNGLASSLTISAGATINRAGGRVMTVTDGIFVTSGSAVLINAPFTAASLTKAGAGTMTLNATALSGGGQEVSGTIDVTGGTLALTGGNALTTGGAITVASGATLSRTGAGAVNAGGLVMVNGTMTFANAGGLSATGGVTVSGGSLSFAGSGGLSSTGAVTVTAGGSLSFSGTGDLTAAQSFSLNSGSSLGLVFNNATTVTTLAVTGSTTLAGTVNITGANPNAASSPFTIVTSTNGPVSVAGISLGTAPTGFAFGFRTSGNTVLMDVTVNPIAFDGTASATGTCPGPVTWSHTVGATANDRYLLVGVSIGNTGGNIAPTSVTYGAQTLGQVAASTSGANNSRAFIFGLVAPARGTNTVTVNLPAGTCNVVAGSVSFTGVNQTTSLGTAVTGTGGGTAASVTAATVQGDKVLSVISSNTASSGTPQAGATVRWSGSQGPAFGAGDTVARSGAGGQNIAMTWTLSAGSTEWAEAAVPIRAAAPTRAGDLVALVRRSEVAASISLRAGAGSDLIGFRVWRETAGRRQLLTPGLVAGPALMSRAAMLAGSDPGWVDAHPTPGSDYLVESLHVDGSTRWTRASAASGPVQAITSTLLGPSPSVVVETPAQRLFTDGTATFRSALVAQDVQWILAAGPAVKLTVSSPGVVHVPAEALFAAGLPVGASSGSIQLFRGGHPVPRTVFSADGASLRAGDAIEFYGYGMDTRYSGSAVYWLTWGNGSGVEFAATPAMAQAAGDATFATDAEIRERLVWFGAARNGDAEKFFGPLISSQADQRTLSLEGLDVTATGARLEVAVVGLLESPHTVNVSLNGNPVGTLSFDGAVPGTASIALPPGALMPGSNTVELVAPSGDFSLEQYVRLVYPRQTVRGSGALEFTLAGGSAARLEGFDPARTRVLDITDADAPIRVGTWDASGAAAVTAPGSGQRRLLAFLPGDTLQPASVRANSPSSWHSAVGADLVVLGPSTLFPGVKALVDQRGSEGLRVALVDIEDIQDEFASGEKSSDAVRAFLAYAQQAWGLPPRFVLLLGSASYDPRDYLGLGGDLMPSATVQTVALETASDSWYLGGANPYNVSIGRLPVRTVDEAQALVAKILGRKVADAHSPVLLVSDVSSTSDFPEVISDLRAALPDAAATVLVRASETDEEVHQRFLEAARLGPALVNYAGHAQELAWGKRLPDNTGVDIFSVDDVAALTAGGTSLWVHMTCSTAFFQDPRRQSLAVATLLTPSGGAWGAWGSTGSTYPSEHPEVNQVLTKALLIDGKTLGEATRDALSNVSDPDLAATFVLLGDPSARAVAQSRAALETPAKSSGALGCSSATPGGAGFAALLLLAWVALLGSRTRVTQRR
jgi:hypothetical protein